MAYIELRFHRVGPLAHQHAVAEIAGIPGVAVIYDHTMQLGLFQRQRILVDEWACRILVDTSARLDQRQPDRREANERDPYRTLEIGGVIHKVPTALREVIDELGASYDVVHGGWLRCSSRGYERALLEQLAEELRTRAGAGARVAVDFDTCLHARVEGSVAKIHALVGWLRRTGMVDPADVRVGYS